LEQLTVAIDGIGATFSSAADVMLNVRADHSLETEPLGVIDPADIDTVQGISADGVWYLIDWEDDYGWVSGLNMTVTVEDTEHLPVFDAGSSDATSPPEVAAADAAEAESESETSDGEG
jgi:hypothetical protein